MNLLNNYNYKTISSKIKTKFNYKNIHELPKIQKIQISSGLGLNAQNRIFLQKAIDEIRTITGQHPILTKAKKSIAAFKTRQNMPIGLKVTLRREKMYSFLERFIQLVLPRIRDFRGLDPDSFDQHGNYSIGIADQTLFPELEFENIDQRRGFNITIVISAKKKIDSYFLLSELGIPFVKK